MDHLVRALALLLALVAALIRGHFTCTARYLGGNLEQDLAVVAVIFGRRRDHGGIICV